MGYFNITKYDNIKTDIQCDTCGEMIGRIGVGWVEWLNENRIENIYKNYEYRICHAPFARRGCTIHDRKFGRCDMGLSYFIGISGMWRFFDTVDGGESIGDNTFFRAALILYSRGGGIDFPTDLFDIPQTRKKLIKCVEEYTGFKKEFNK